ncbi:Nucleobase-ascorbate transporter LPE1 [Cocos nucifera]|uniref:Nucleobase-ascorbate transporter LPE1 n=1 Tax=Cocos nucifera TaxID=13894 RepID=A0A8K0ITJ9_COCNU|nr:Nucleobase-ascorbate transporter LPE1 [Cocos nucifera]
MAPPPAKLDEFVPHPVKEQFPGIDFCITSPPPWPEAIVLGFQHFLVMLGTTVLIPTILVPQMGGGDEEKARVIQTLLFVAGINTFLQGFFGTRLPAVIGGSFTYLLPTISIILSRRFIFIIDPYVRFVHTMRAIQGALIAASSFQIIVGFFGIWRIVIRFLSPLAAVPIVTLAALGLFYIGFPNLARCVEVGLPALVLLIFFSQVMNISQLIALNDCHSTGTLIAVSRFASATPVPPAIFSRGIGWQGIGILLDGMFGTANGSAASVENAGLLGLTRVGSRRVIHIAACFMLFFSILGKFGALLASIPLPIVAALYCILFAYAGSLRTKFILGFSLFMGLSVPEYFKEYEILAGYGPVHTRSRANC